MTRLRRFALAGLLATTLNMQASAHVGTPNWLIPAPVRIEQPRVNGDSLIQVSAHAWVIPDSYIQMVPNVGFVVGSKGVLVIDTGLGRENGAVVAAIAARFAKGNPVYVVLTHSHPEHELGAAAFPSTTKIIRSHAEAADVALQGSAVNKFISAMSPVYAALIAGVPFRKTDIAFDGEYTVSLGDVRVQIVALGTNHTAGDTAVWLRSERVLFGGDLVMAWQPYPSSQSTIVHWFSTLNRLERLHPLVIVPAHGPLGDVSLIHAYRAYLTEINSLTLASKAAGLDLPATQSHIAAVVGVRYPDRVRLDQAVRVAYGPTS